MKKLLCAASAILVGLSFAQPLLHASTFTVGANVTSYDVAVFDNKTHVAYESGGNVYYAWRDHTTNSWSSSALVGAGSGPSLTWLGTTPLVSYMVAGSVNIAAWGGSSWNTTDLGATNGSFAAMVRTDGSGTPHLLINGSGTSGRGSIDYAFFNGSAWSAFSNLAYGWYDSGSGNYYHQAVLGANPSGAGYAYLFEFDNWGGNASWSSKEVTSSGYSTSFSQGYGWNSSSVIAPGGHDWAANGLAAAGYTIAGIGYVRTYDGAVWSDSTSLGTAQNVSVLRDSVNNLTLALFDQGLPGNLQFFNGSQVEQLTIDGSPVAGRVARFGALADQEIFYLDNTTGALMAYAVPEPTTGVLLTFGAGFLFLGRRLRRTAKR